MSETASIEVGKPNGELWISCGPCDRKTRHEVLTVVKWQDGDDNVTLWKSYMTVMCQGCRTVSFCIESQFSEDYEYDEHEDGYYVKRYELYPNRITGRPEMDSARDIPEGIYDLYAETRTALCSNQPILTGIGIRAIVEAVCKDRGATGHNLEKRIDSLVILKIVTEDGAKILHNLRFMGNDAAHEVKAHKIDELSIAFGVLEYLLQGVYIMPKQASMLPQNIKILPKKPKP